MNEKPKDKVKRQSVIRNWFQAAWFVLTNSYLRGFTKGKIFTGNTKVFCLPGLNCYSCPGAIGSCPMGSLQAVMGDSTFRISLYVFGMLAAFGVLFGRLVCGWMCPFGLFQDLLYRIPVRLKKKNLPGHKYLKYLKYVILVIFPILLVSVVTDLTGTSSPWFCEWICPSGMLLGGIPLTALNASLRAAAGIRFAWKMFILIAITLLSVIYYRPFCKYLCPLGAIYSLFNPISSYRLVVDKDKCISCGACQRACGMDIKTFETPNSLECIRCGSCMKACPVEAISSTWGRTGQKIRSRCFVDEDAVSVTGDGTSSSLSAKALFYGIVTIITALVNTVGIIYLGLFSSIKNRFSVEAYANMNGLYIVTFLLWAIALFVLLFTGIFAIRKRKDPKAISSVTGKAALAFLFELLSLVVLVIGAVIDLGTISVYLNPILLSVSFFLGVPLAVLTGKALARFANSEISGEPVKKGRKAIWVILSVFYVLNLAVMPVLLVTLRNMVQ